jgi:drug/metabolite transporter (DMT)-like permease
MEMLAGGAALLVLSLAGGEFSRLHLEAVDARAWWSLLYLIVGGSLIGYTAYSWLIRVAPTPLVATYAYVNPLVAVFMGWLLAGEPLTLRVALAAAIIVGAVVVINLRK